MNQPQIQTYILKLIFALYLVVISLILSCGKNSSQEYRSENILKYVETDMARYDIGEPVKYRLEFNEPVQGKTLRLGYYYEGQRIAETIIAPENTDFVEWIWQPPKKDYAGYLTEILLEKNHRRIDRVNIAVDVSSSLKTYPRYGFISKYPELSDEEINSIIKKLNRFYINGLQFYDWHNTHHDPLKGTIQNPADTWQDIGNRTIHRSTIEKYIATAHQFNMTTMAYNLLYGAWTSGFQEGVRLEWGLYKDKNHKEPRRLNLPDSWADDIYFMNPADPKWKNYLFKNMSKVFQALDFDGWHVDQIGDLGILYDYDGDTVILRNTFTAFLNEAKEILNTRLVMNAVAQYGWAEIAVAPVEFLYNEVWNPDSTFNDLVKILERNQSISGRNNTVLPAYMNYANSSNPGKFNTPGILLTDAVIFANGGAHLELGEHMLCHEYFPNSNLSMDHDLEEALIDYYDFFVAYQTLLRSPELQSGTMEISSTQYVISKISKLGTIWTFCKHLENKDVIHLINLLDVTNLNWRDPYGNRPEPVLQKNIPLQFTGSRKTLSITMASPDYLHGSPVSIDFKQKDDITSLNIPTLKYWDMLIVEYEN
ncbi:MAG: glycoside hydrolase family 66 protein [Candidatus Marinimicrobia bacterium]|nr:glycoside hydrolase family 66 protein [Candidatus Neomarinimicrobiota bacterium]